MIILAIILLFIVFITGIFDIYIKLKIDKQLKWTHLEIIESVQHPNEKLIVFWNDETMSDCFYIDANGRPVNHDKDKV